MRTLLLAAAIALSGCAHAPAQLHEVLVHESLRTTHFGTIFYCDYDGGSNTVSVPPWHCPIILIDE